MDDHAAERHILDWDENDVQNWLSGLGYPQYESQIREHKIQGDSLCELDSEGLKSLGITTIGQRLSILKSIYLVKLAHEVPIDENHYVPPSEAFERFENISVEKLHLIVKTQAQRLRGLEENIRNLTTTMQFFVEEINSIRSSGTTGNGTVSIGTTSSNGTEDSNSSLRRQPSFQWAQFVKPLKSPTKGEAVDSPHPSPHRVDYDVPNHSRNGGSSPLPLTTNTAEKSKATQGVADASISVLAPSKPRHDSSDAYKFKVSLEDPTWKVLPAALKKYRINNDNWQNYAMFICYGSPSNRIERCLSYDEKPLLLFQKLKDAKKNPVFMLKHIKDIRSPIAVAQQKHAARQASSVISHETVVTQGHQKAAPTSRNAHRPPKLEVQSLATPTSSAGSSLHPGWSEGNGNAALVGDQDAMIPGSATTQTSQFSTSSTLVGSNGNGHDPTKPRSGNADTEPVGGGSSNTRELPVASNGVSYAVAIYPYMAEQDDEFDVVVGDTFVILSRARGWWVVQRDPTGSGIVDTDIVKQGWVPAGCLLETNVPVASAIAEATAAKNGSTSELPPDTLISKTPILPLSIISTSFPGIALMDYSKKGDEELDLVKDDALRVFKRYNHWSYAVKEVGGDRGWVPSWFIGKVSTAGVVSPPSNTSSNLPVDDSSTQVSPLSSAFPPPPQLRTPTS